MNGMKPLSLPAGQIVEDSLAIIATGGAALTELSALGPQMIQRGIMAQAANEVSRLPGKQAKYLSFSVLAIGYPVQKGG